MRSVLGIFGSISLATKNTAVYSADKIDWATISAKIRTYRSSSLFVHASGGHDLYAVFNTPADFNPADDFTPLIQDSADDSTYVDIMRGWTDGSDARGWTYYVTGANGTKKGVCAILPWPAIHRRYTRVGAVPKSTGTFTAATMVGYLEHGPNFPW